MGMMNMFKGGTKEPVEVAEEPSWTLSGETKEPAGKPVEVAEERIFSVSDKRAGRITNRTWQRSRTRSKKGGRSLGKGVVLADGKFRSNYDLALGVKCGMDPENVPALSDI